MLVALLLFISHCYFQESNIITTYFKKMYLKLILTPMLGSADAKEKGMENLSRKVN